MRGSFGIIGGIGMHRMKMAAKLGLNLVEKRLGYHLNNNPNRLMEDGIKWITVHQTGNTTIGADAENHHEYLRNDSRGKRVSWHYTVDEKKALQHFRDERVTWHSGRVEGNESSISIELSIDSDKAGEPIMGEDNYKKTLDNGAKLIAIKLVEHGLTPDKVRQHYDWNRKSCPAQIRRALYGISWGQFMDAVKQYYMTLTVPEKVEEPELAPEGKLFNVRLGAFKDRSNAQEVLDVAKAAGLDAYLVLMDDPDFQTEEEK